jgi:hypothetical protein
MLAEFMTLLDVALISFLLGLGLRPFADRIWKKLNDKLDEWADV